MPPQISPFIPLGELTYWVTDSNWWVWEEDIVVTQLKYSTDVIKGDNAALMAGDGQRNPWEHTPLCSLVSHTWFIAGIWLFLWTYGKAQELNDWTYHNLCRRLFSTLWPPPRTPGTPPSPAAEICFPRDWQLLWSKYIVKQFAKWTKIQFVRSSLCP